MLSSTVYLVGAGPGDSKLITLKGFELIKNADCIIYDYLANPGLLKFRKNNCKLIYVGKKAGAHTLAQDKINQLLARAAKVYSFVVRLKGGDPFIFGRGAEEALYLRKKKINFEVVPGVTSAIAAPAYAGIPLTERSIASTIGFITGHEDPHKLDSGIDWQALTKALGTMVFLMGVGNLDLIVKRLIACGKPKNTPVAVIRWGTTARQKTITGTLSNIVNLSQKNKIFSPAIIVVGETVGLSKKLNWFEKKPLFAKRIIVTRTREQASALSEKLRDLGAEVIEIPTIKIVSQKADKQLKQAFSNEKYDWVFFTSQNGVDEFAAFLNRAGKDSRIFGSAKICAIGAETAKSLQAIGIKPDYVPQQFVSESIVKHFRNMSFKDTSRRALIHSAASKPRHSGRGQQTPLSVSTLSPSASLRMLRRMLSESKHKPRAETQCTSNGLILRARKARDILPNGLKQAGFKVKVIGLYDTVIPKDSALNLKQELKERVDFITFTSSSTVENFIKLLGEDYRHKLSRVKFASIGPVTSATLKKFGLKADIEAREYTTQGLVEALVKKT